MPVLINFKICDNAKECLGIANCPTGAFYWDEKKKSIAINDEKCTDCGLCEACEVDAVHVAKTDEEYQKIKKEIEEDPRKVTDLYVDRYGAQPVHKAYNINEDKFELEVLGSARLVAAEIFTDETIECLIKSIPIKELFEGVDIKYRKVKLSDKKLCQEYEIKDLPALLFFKEGKLLGKIEGYFDKTQKEELKEKISNIINV